MLSGLRAQHFAKKTSLKLMLCSSKIPQLATSRKIIRTLMTSGVFLLTFLLGDIQLAKLAEARTLKLMCRRKYVATVGSLEKKTPNKIQ